MKYIVAEGHSFSYKGKILGTGDEITEAAFSDKSAFKKYLDKKWIVKADDSSEKDDPEPSAKSLESMTKEELLEYAAKKGIPVSGNKSDIITAIKSAESKADEITGTETAGKGGE